MPAMFLAVSKNFTIVGKEGIESPAKQLADAFRQYIELSIFQPETPNVSINFEVSDLYIAEGSLNISEDGDNVSVQCDCVAKINVKANYVDQFLSPKTKWIFNSACGIRGEVDGLVSEEYEVKTFRGPEKEMHYLIDVKTAKNIKGVK